MGKVVGPGAIVDDQIAPKPSLEGASEWEYVTILNPLTDDFAIKVAQSKPVNMPFEIRQDKSGKTQAVTQTEGDARSMYGLSLKNPDFQAKAHISNTTVIRAGRTINLKGDEAQVAVRQLVNEIMQREGRKQFLADPTARKAVEDRIIIARGSMQDLMDGNLRSPQQQINEAINASNEEPNAFPTIDRGAVQESAAGTGDSSDQASAQPERTAKRGRPAKAQAENAPEPAK